MALMRTPWACSESSTGSAGLAASNRRRGLEVLRHVDPGEAGDVRGLLAGEDWPENIQHPLDFGRFQCPQRSVLWIAYQALTLQLTEGELRVPSAIREEGLED